MYLYIKEFSYLVHWKGYSSAFDQWYLREVLMENASALVETYEKLHKLSFEELQGKKT